MSKPVFKIKKTWQMDRLTCMLQLAPVSSSRENTAKKVFLKLSAQTQSRGVTSVHEKPEFTPIKHAFNELLRKYVPQGVIGQNYLSNKVVYLAIHTKKDLDQPDFIIAVGEGHERYIELIDTVNSESIVRISPAGTFTKRKSITLPDFKWEDLTIFDVQTPPRLKEINRNDTQDPTKQIDISLNQKTLIQKLKRRLRTINKSLTKQLESNVSSRDIEDLETKAKFLKSYSYLVKPDSYELILDTAQTGLEDVLTIPLDPEKTSGDNLNSMFVKVKKWKRGIAIQEEQKEKTKQGLQSITQDIARLQATSLSDVELNKIANEHQISFEPNEKKTVRNNESVSTPFKVYISADTRILVGKGPSENDELTKKAKANDFWLHAVGQSGSHVLVDGSKFKNEDLPEAIFHDAAILALHYSKARQDKAGEVYFTRRHNIRKRKGMAPGLWIVDLAKSIFLRYTDEELKTTLDKLQI